ncbi:MAG TPA: ribosome maturation factor RimP [Thermoanaerobaculia bacterium]|jgi:ribosome maturation factor RimP
MKQAALPFDGGTADLIRQRIAAFGLDLCHMEWKPGARATLTLYVDKPAGVTLKDCEIASRAASEILDPLEEKLPDYALEVSSPGLDRPLWTLDDCVRFRGRRVAVQLVRKVDGAARLKGVLEDVKGDTLTVLDEDQHRRYTARFGDVRLARLVPEL